jgi:hypothetical protein
MSKDFEVKVLPPQTAVERTQAAMVGMSEGRRNQARAFFNRVAKRKRARKLEKAQRKRMR